MITIPLANFEQRQNWSEPWAQVPRIDGLFIAGGVCRKLFLGQYQDSDIDVFAKSKAALEACREQLELAGFEFKWGNENVAELRKGTLKVQLIGLQLYHTVEELLDSFDFTICQFALSDDRQCLIATENAVIDAARKRLVIHKVRYAVATMKRFWKYKQQGFEPCNGTFTDFCNQVKSGDVNTTTQYID